MPTILDTLRKGTEYLEKHSIEEARLNMEHLIAHVLKIERIQLYLDFDRPLDESALAPLRELTKRRSRGEPLQHLLGTVHFCDLDFLSDPRALVPRPETEELVSLLLAREWPPGVRVLDLGCGSGVIGLSLAYHLGENASVTLSDLSPDALALALENAKELGLANRVTLIESDLLAALEGPFDLIAANLPYVARGEETALSNEVRRDPAMALYGGDQGTEIMEKLLHEAPPHLQRGGLIALEFGIGQEETLRILAEDLGYDPVVVKRDLNGIPRFLFATKSA